MRVGHEVVVRAWRFKKGKKKGLFCVFLLEVLVFFFDWAFCDVATKCVVWGVSCVLFMCYFVCVVVFLFSH